MPCSNPKQIYIIRLQIKNVLFAKNIIFKFSGKSLDGCSICSIIERSRNSQCQIVYVAGQNSKTILKYFTYNVFITDQTGENKGTA